MHLKDLIIKYLDRGTSKWHFNKCHSCAILQSNQVAGFTCVRVIVIVQGGILLAVGNLEEQWHFDGCLDRSDLVFHKSVVFDVSIPVNDRRSMCNRCRHFSKKLCGCDRMVKLAFELCEILTPVGIASMCRRHPSPTKEMLEPLLRTAAAIGLDLDVSSSKALADSLDRAVVRLLCHAYVFYVASDAASLGCVL